MLRGETRVNPLEGIDDKALDNLLAESLTEEGDGGENKSEEGPEVNPLAQASEEELDKSLDELKN